MAGFLCFFDSWSGVNPSLFGMCISAPFSSNNAIFVISPLFTAKCSGVSPFIFLAFILQKLLINHLIASEECLWVAQLCKNVYF